MRLQRIRSSMLKNEEEFIEEEYDDNFSVVSKGVSIVSVVWAVLRVLIFVAALISIVVFFLSSASVSLKRSLGIEAVTLMYDFDSLDEVRENQKCLAQIMDEDTYAGLTIDNENRQLYTYVRYYGNKSIINIVEATDQYVLYRIESDCVEPDRLFIMIFEVSHGRISKIKECECLDFIEDVDYLY